MTRPAPLPTCNHVPHVEGSTLVYQGHYGAPGIGWAAVCSQCGADFSVVGDTAYDPATHTHELRPEDVI